jgi:hypothetical protein
MRMARRRSSEANRLNPRAASKKTGVARSVRHCAIVQYRPSAFRWALLIRAAEHDPEPAHAVIEEVGLHTAYVESVKRKL